MKKTRTKPTKSVKETIETTTMEAKDTKLCPYCAELIKVDAKKCKHCKEMLDHELRNQTRNWSPGVAAVLSFFIPGLGQIYKGQIAEGFFCLILTLIGYFFFVLPGIVIHICVIVGAARVKPD
jgi:TM2 domain-containing membrane protein YozV